MGKLKPMHGRNYIPGHPAPASPDLPGEIDRATSSSKQQQAKHMHGTTRACTPPPHLTSLGRATSSSKQQAKNRAGVIDRVIV